MAQNQTLVVGKLKGFKDGGRGYSRLFIEGSSNGTRLPENYEPHDNLDVWVPDDVQVPGPGAMVRCECEPVPANKVNPKTGMVFPEVLIVAKAVTAAK